MHVNKGDSCLDQAQLYLEKLNNRASSVELQLAQIILSAAQAHYQAANVRAKVGFSE